MKTEKEIRAFRDDLREVDSRSPELCTCPECRGLGEFERMLKEKIKTLSWVLGEFLEGDAVVERAAKAARQPFEPFAGS